ARNGRICKWRGPPAFAPVILIAGLISESHWLALIRMRVWPPPLDRWNEASLHYTSMGALLDAAQLGPESDLPFGASNRGTTGCSRSDRVEQPCPGQRWSLSQGCCPMRRCNRPDACVTSAWHHQRGRSQAAR